MNKLLIKLDDIMRKSYNKITQYILGKAMLRLIEGIILAILISTIALVFTIVKEKFDFNNRLHQQVAAFSIGTNEEYINNLLGTPKYQIMYSEYDFNENFYLIDGIVVRGVFRDECLIAYFFTITDEKRNKDINLGLYSDLVNNKTLSNFSYYEIAGSPNYVTGFFTNGSGLACYIEDYYFASSGNYYGFIFATLPYGIFNVETTSYDEYIKDDEIAETMEDYYLNGEIQDGTKKVEVSPPTTLNRQLSNPSTFGVYGFNIETDEVLKILTDWNSLDYFTLINETSN